MTDPGSQEDFLASYDPRAYDPIAVTVDLVTLTIRDGGLHVLLVQRGVQHFAAQWALPGGFVPPGGRSGAGDPQPEDLPEAAIRELSDETGEQLGKAHLEQLGSYGTPGRDPRMRVISVAYLAFAPELPEPRAGGYTSAAAWVPTDNPGPADGAARPPPGKTKELALYAGGVVRGRTEPAR